MVFLSHMVEFIYSLADSALAFCSNSHGRKKKVFLLRLPFHIQFLYEKKEEITAVAEEVSFTDKIAVYYITVSNHTGKNSSSVQGYSL